MADDFDLIVIGAGSTGENVAGRAAEAGLDVAIVESELVGGECSYWACMPSKALLRPGEAIAEAKATPGVADAVTGEVDVEAALERRDAFTSNWDDKYQVEWLESMDVELVRGVGRLAGERTVEVTTDDGGTRTLTASRAVAVATGTVAAVPPIDGMDQIETWDNRDITAAKQIPERLVVLGGGFVGCEMAQAFKRLGSQEVTVVEMADRLLSAEEPFAGEQLAEAFAQDGIDVRVDTQAVGVSRDGSDGPVTLTLADGAEVEGDELVVAVGRTPNTDDIGLETVGLEAGGYIDVDDQLRATGVDPTADDQDWLYAVGDVNGRSLLTHMGKYQARLAADHILGDDDVEAWADHGVVPRVVFTDPHVAAVGLTEEQARDTYDSVEVVSYGTSDVAGAPLLGQGYDGTSQLVVDTDREVLVGATFTGPRVGEMLHAATIAIAGEVPMSTLWHAVPSFPTVSEVWLRLLEEYGL